MIKKLSKLLLLYVNVVKAFNKWSWLVSIIQKQLNAIPNNTHVSPDLLMFPHLQYSIESDGCIDGIVYDSAPEMVRDIQLWQHKLIQVTSRLLASIIRKNLAAPPTTHTVKVNDLVFIDRFPNIQKKYLELPLLGPYRVISVVKNHATVCLFNNSRKELTIHVRRLRKNFCCLGVSSDLSF